MGTNVLLMLTMLYHRTIQQNKLLILFLTRRYQSTLATNTYLVQWQNELWELMADPSVDRTIIQLSTPVCMRFGCQTDPLMNSHITSYMRTFSHNATQKGDNISSSAISVTIDKMILPSRKVMNGLTQKRENDEKSQPVDGPSSWSGNMDLLNGFLSMI